MIEGKKKLLLSIVIVNYRTPGFVKDCLTSLLPELSQLNAKVALVDNNSPDSSSQEITKWLEENDANSKVTFIQSDYNGGFAAGNNIGIKAMEATYYLLLNSDTLIREGAISTMLETAENEKSAGMVSPRLEWPDERGQESCFRFHHPFSEFMLAAQTGFLDGVLKRFIVAMPVQENKASPEWTSFACVLIRQDVFTQVGLLDEGYFMYFEDAEFCSRARKVGWSIVHNPQARVVHLRGGSSPVKKNAMQKKRLPSYYYESRTRFFYQQYGYLGLMFSNCMWSLGRVISKTRQIIGRPDKSVSKKQWLDIWKNCSNPLGQYTHPES